MDKNGKQNYLRKVKIRSWMYASVLFFGCLISNQNALHHTTKGIMTDVKFSSIIFSLEWLNQKVIGSCKVAVLIKSSVAIARSRCENENLS